MLHELILALYGYPGSIFVLNPSGEIKMVDSLPFCHPGEKEVFNRVCRLATSNYRLSQFVEDYGNFIVALQGLDIDEDPLKSTAPECGPSLDGIYIRVLCQGLKKVLSPYKQSLVKLEQELLKDPHLTVSYVQCSLEQYQTVLPALVHLVDDVLVKQPHGCQVLDVIHSHSSSGFPMVVSVMKQIQQTCHNVFLKTLAEWLLYGILTDPYKEFFVGAACRNGEQTDGAATEELNFEPRNPLNVDATDWKKNSTTVEFSLKGHMIPSYIPVTLAETILFVGESMHTFEQNNSPRTYRYSKDGDTGSFIPEEKKDSFARDLYDLKSEKELVIAKLESVVDNIRGCVAEHLWALIVEKSNVVGHVKALKDFYLLGRGDFYTTFLEQAASLLDVPPTINTQQMVSHTFQLCSRSVVPDEDVYFENFKLQVDHKPKQHSVGDIQVFKTPETATTGWNCLQLTYAPPWPLHTIFTPDVLEKLNIVFQFLLHIRRVQLMLHDCWVLQMKAGRCKQEVGDSKVWQLRTNMSFIVDDLQYYLQVDVLESQYNVLLEKISGTRDFQQVQMAFHTFLTNILHQTFLLTKPISQFLQEFLQVCLSYCTYLKHTDRPDTSQVQAFAKEFSRHTALLLTVLSGIRGHQLSVDA